MSAFERVRDDMVAYVRSQLVGPYGGPDEVIADAPNRRYLMGILFPRNVEIEPYTEAEGERTEVVAGGDKGGDENLFSDDPVSAANDFLPASQGISFFTSATAVQIDVSAAWYETLNGESADAAVVAASSVGTPTEGQDGDPRRRRRRVWRRQPLPAESVRVTESGSTQVLEGRASFEVRWRTVAGHALVTVTLVNTAVGKGDEPVDRLWDQMLLQCAFTIRALDGQVLEYPSVAAARHDEEEDELRLQHREAKTYAVGHGCAPVWAAAEPVTEVRTEVMPSHVVPAVTADVAPAGSRALDIAWLADSTVLASALKAELTGFVDDYAAWVAAQHEQAAVMTSPRERDAAGRIVVRLDRAVQRMRQGVELLSQPGIPLASFRWANEAMLRQMRHSKPDLAGARRARADAAELPSAYEPGPTWRAFQLGFVLSAVEGLAGADPDNERDIVDLIWFPTGGGKTEAYLLLAAFEIFRRRLVHGSAGGGTAVLSRYTLTLLTTQQFQRAATTICACERIRAENAGELGSEPISIGLWVGEAATPNRYSKAASSFEELREANVTDDRFLLERCPWCGTEILPREHSDDPGDYGISATDTTFNFRCTSGRCEFHPGLPVHVVDDDLYDYPPTFVLGTVDKFAGLAWEPEAGKLFGRPAAKLPPTLVIQDELHLLTGPLGTTVGLYESAIERLCEYEGRLPKVVASTATIRRAPDQVVGLFGRGVDLFPPSGLSADESYFARADKTRGRLFVGVMAQGHTSDTAAVHALAAMVQAPTDLGLTGPAKDVYWTLVAYHSSLRELGRTVTLARDDVPARLSAVVKGRPVRTFEVEELTSNIERSQQPRLLERLNLSYEKSGKVEFLATTNMLSVGVDIPRLGLMLMNGQPKATAEYIQATSRVGRAHHPGLVFSLFRSTRPRDRSHYENFLPFHAALYRYVEPTSVTPFSPRSRDRALHAALVILVRHHLRLSADGDAGRIIDHVPAVDQYIEQLVAVAQLAEPREAGRTRQELEYFRDDWIARARDATAQNKILYYKPAGKGQLSLLRDFGSKGNAWETLRSMRNVDRESVLDVAKGMASGSTGGKA